MFDIVYTQADVDAIAAVKVKEAVLAERERWITRDYYKGRKDGQLYEREECAKTCEQHGESNKGFPLSAKSYAAAIRARSEK